MRPHCPSCQHSMSRVDQATDPIATYRCQECRSVTTQPTWSQDSFEAGYELREDAETSNREGDTSWAGVGLEGPDSQFVQTDTPGQLRCRRCSQRVAATCTDLHDCP